MTDDSVTNENFFKLTSVELGACAKGNFYQSYCHLSFITQVRAKKSGFHHLGIIEGGELELF